MDKTLPDMPPELAVALVLYGCLWVLALLLVGLGWYWDRKVAALEERLAQAEKGARPPSEPPAF